MDWANMEHQWVSNEPFIYRMSVNINIFTYRRNAASETRTTATMFIVILCRKIAKLRISINKCILIAVRRTSYFGSPKFVFICLPYHRILSSTTKDTYDAYDNFTVQL